MSDLSVFAFDTRAVRVVMVDGEPWFVGKDVAEVLGYTNHNKALGDHCKGVTKRYTLASGGNQEMSFIPEGEWISGDVKPTKVGEKAICLTDYGNIVLGEVISYRGELIWEEHNLFGGTFTPVYWMKIPELPKM